LRSRCFRKPRSERGAGQYEARNEGTTKDLRKQIEQARPTQLNRSGLGRDHRRRAKRRALPTTTRSLRPMAAAQRAGLTMPAAARGTAAAL
jgi:hypothetical protein